MIKDFLLSNEFKSIVNKKFEWILLEKEHNKPDFLNAIKYYCESKNSVLIVLEETPVDMVFAISQRWKAKVCIINSSCGLASFSQKWYWDLWDISKASSFGLEVLETVYSEQVLEFLESRENSCYIRANKHVLSQEELPKYKKNSDFLIFENFGTDWTIISFGTLLLDALYAQRHLDSLWKKMDLFVSSKLFFSLTDELLASLNASKKLYIIIDQHRWSLYNSWITSLISNSKLKNIQIEIICPYYNEVSSIAEEYMYEQAKVDGFSISKQISKN